MQTKIEDTDFPAFYQATNNSSVRAQKYYLWLVKIDLSLMFMAAVLSVFQFNNTEYQRCLNAVLAFLLCSAFIVSLWLRNRRFEKTWYGGRAAAESIKSLSWKYMLGASPFELSLNNGEADKKLLSHFQEILNAKKDLALDLAYNSSGQITSRMRSLRLESFASRKEAYLNDRVKDQADWYNSKSLLNGKKESAYFLVAIFVQFVAVGWSVILVVEPQLQNIVGVFTTLVAVLFSWMQIKKYQELAQAYSVTFHELGFIEAAKDTVTNEIELSDFVVSAETAISREHTMWIARRDF